MAKGVVRTDAPIEDRAKKYEVTADVTIAPNVPHGVHAFRVETPLGVSNLLRFAVSSLRGDRRAGAERTGRRAEGDAAGDARRRARSTPGTSTPTSFAPARARRWSSRWSRARWDRASTASSGCSTRTAACSEQQRRRSEPRLRADMALRRSRQLHVDDRGRRARRRRERVRLPDSRRRPALRHRSISARCPGGRERRRRRHGREPRRSGRAARRGRPVGARRPDDPDSRVRDCEALPSTGERSRSAVSGSARSRAERRTGRRAEAGDSLDRERTCLDARGRVARRRAHARIRISFASPRAKGRSSCSTSPPSSSARRSIRSSRCWTPTGASCRAPRSGASRRRRLRSTIPTRAAAACASRRGTSSA